MSKWISDFNPPRDGWYLIRRIYKNVHGDGVYYNRVNYDSTVNRYYYRNGQRLFLDGKTNWSWWDEYGITENKRIKKLKF